MTSENMNFDVLDSMCKNAIITHTYRDTEGVYKLQFNQYLTEKLASTLILHLRNNMKWTIVSYIRDENSLIIFNDQKSSETYNITVDIRRKWYLRFLISLLVGSILVFTLIILLGIFR